MGRDAGRTPVSNALPLSSRPTHQAACGEASCEAVETEAKTKTETETHVGKRLTLPSSTATA